MIENDSELFKVDVENYNGPLDVLLDLAKAQKVNLEDISITKLADQFHDFITQEKKLNLEIASEYLLMATWLTYLKSKLLLPLDEDEEFITILELDDGSEIGIDDETMAVIEEVFEDLEPEHQDQFEALFTENRQTHTTLIDWVRSVQ